ncbi:sugar kinase [Priestia endophytica]|uniref:sugar kinase n=1 Tax=Priestia endophytica TaxID=135735 RepID=UPI001CEF71EF|nr:sugar kinase [Priestia endophytica]
MKMSRILTVGEPMALFVAEKEGPLEDVEYFSRHVAGAEVNFSIGMARLDHSVTYITKLGKDPFGTYIEKFLKHNGINTSLIQYEQQYSTGMQWKQKVKSGDPDVFSARKNSAASHMDTDTLKNLDLASFDHLHLTGIPPALSLGCREMVFELIKSAKAKGVQISYDTNLRYGLWDSQDKMIKIINELAFQADIIFPGIEEGRILTGKENEQDIANFYHQEGVQTVVIKLGPKGAFTSSQGKSFYTDGFPVKEVVDTVGAGDAFAVGVVSALLEEQPLDEAVKRGTVTGALAVMSPGDNEGLPYRGELDKVMKDSLAQS